MNKIRKRKSPAKIMEVIIDGEIIREKNSTETFLSVLRILGVEKIASIKDIRVEGLPLVVPSKDWRMQMKKLDDEWYVCTHMSTLGKKRLLELLAQKLGVDICVKLS